MISAHIRPASRIFYVQPFKQKSIKKDSQTKPQNLNIGYGWTENK